MDRKEAKSILLLYRPGTADDDDPDFAEARALAAADEELKTWFKAHCAVQLALRAKFAQIPIPDGLKEQILAESKGHPAFGHRLTPGLVAACVAVVLAIIGAFAYLHQRNTGEEALANFRNRMVGLVQRQYPEMDLETNDVRAINQYLAQKGRGGYALPERLSKAVPTGCAIIPWHGHPVSMVCFNSGKPANTAKPDLFLFVMDRSDIPNAPAVKSPQVARPTQRFATATWTDAGKIYVLGGFGDDAFINRFL